MKYKIVLRYVNYFEKTVDADNINEAFKQANEESEALALGMPNGYKECGDFDTPIIIVAQVKEIQAK